MQADPLISVILPCYNAAQYVRIAMDSIIAQTYTQFEILAVNDGSVDNTLSILESYTDERIRIINQENQGLVATLNKAIGLARGKYIARMDADDICEPERFERQVRFMEQNEQMAICGCGVVEFTDDGRVHKHFYPATPGCVKVEALFSSPLPHPGVMIRKSVLTDNAWQYDKEVLHAEDYDLWSRVLLKYDCTNLPSFLLRYRINTAGITAGADKNVEARKKTIGNIHRRNLHAIGIDLNEFEDNLHFCLSLSERIKNIDFSTYSLKQISRYLHRLKKDIVASGYAASFPAKRTLGKIYFKVVYLNLSRLKLNAILSVPFSSFLYYGISDLLLNKLAYQFNRK